MNVGTFEVDVHFDGVFYYGPTRYVDGQVLELQMKKYDSYDELLDMLEKNTLSMVSGIYYVIPGTDLQTGLLKIQDTFDLARMYDISYCYGKIHMYLNHLQTHEEALEDYLCMKSKKVNPGEIEDGNAIGSSSKTPPSRPPAGLQDEAIEDPVDVDNDSDKVETRAGDAEDLDEDEPVVEEAPAMKLARRLFYENDKGKGKTIEEEVVEDSESDSDYVFEAECSSDSESDTASVDYLSEGEDELREMRLRKIEAKKLPKTAKQPTLVGQLGNINPEADMVVEHDEFITSLLQKLKGNEDEDQQDPFQMAENLEKWPIHNRDTPWRLKKPQVGERYPNHYAFKECLTYYGLANGFSLWYEKSTQKKVIARCGQRPPIVKDPVIGKQRKQNMYPATVKGEESKCPWRCYGKKMNEENSFQVVSLWDDHNCTRNFRFGSLVSYKWIGKQFGNKIRAFPDIKLVQIADMVMKKYKCMVTHNQCRAAKTYALIEFQKSIEDHYGMLRPYQQELIASNPGSTVTLNCNRGPDGKLYFERMYICLKGLKEGWKAGCRKVIALDGCFMKSPATGELLTAIGRDGNNHIYPIAWALVNVENKDNWTWFLEALSGDLDIECGVGVTIISDQHKGLIEAVKDMLPYAEHRQCARHIYEGFRKRFSGVHFRSMFWAASKASYPALFLKVMKDIRDVDPRAHQYLMDKNPRTWSRAYFKLNRGCESVENGFSECFNSVILSVRNKPIITMFEAIRAIIMERQSVMRTLCLKWKGDICPSIQNRLEWVKDQQRFWKPFHAGGEHWEVRQLYESFKVNLKDRTCSCRMWELSGIPCPHGCAVILKIGRCPEDYVPGWFRKHKYFEIYNYHIMPVGGMSTWALNTMEKPLPPPAKKMPGRPKKKRRRAGHELGSQRSKAGGGNINRISKEGMVMTCGKCGQKGHNRVKCVNEELERPAKMPNKGGRPKRVPNQGEPEGQPSGSRHTQASRGQASVSLNGQHVAQASVEIGANSRGNARATVGGEHVYEATVNVTGGNIVQENPSPVVRSLPVEEHDDQYSTPVQTQESQTGNGISPPVVPKPRWTKSKVLQDTSPMKGTSAGPSRKYKDNVVMNSHSVLTRASAALGVTSVGFQNLKTRGPYRLPTWWGAGLCIDPITNESFIGGADGIPVPIWPKDVPIPSASEELAKKQQGLASLRKKASDEGKKRAVAAVKKMMQRDVLGGVEGPTDSGHETRSLVRMSAPQLKPASEGRSNASASGTGCIIRTTGGATKQTKTQPSPIKKRAPSQRILSRKLAKKIDGPGSTYDSAVSIE